MKAKYEVGEFHNFNNLSVVGVSASSHSVLPVLC